MRDSLSYRVNLWCKDMLILQCSSTKTRMEKNLSKKGGNPGYYF